MYSRLKSRREIHCVNIDVQNAASGLCLRHQTGFQLRRWNCCLHVMIAVYGALQI